MFCSFLTQWPLSHSLASRHLNSLGGSAPMHILLKRLRERIFADSLRLLGLLKTIWKQFNRETEADVRDSL